MRIIILIISILIMFREAALCEEELILDRWQQTLKAIKQDGTFAEIYTRWLPGRTPPMETERIGVLK